MKMTKILARVSVCALAASAMAISAFAADPLATKTGNAESAVKYVVDFTNIDATKVDKVVVDISVDSGFCNGCIGYNVDGVWTSVDKETPKETTKDQWIVDSLNGALGAEPYMEVQLWWVNPFYDEQGNETDKEGTATIDAITLYDASGNVVVATGESKGDDTKKDDTKKDDTKKDDTKKDDTKTDNTKKDDAKTDNTKKDNTKKDAAKTGDAGVGLALAGLTIAGAAAFVTKKRK